MPILPESSFPDIRLAQIDTHKGRSLPRWSAEGAVYHVAMHLADSVPQAELAVWRGLRLELQQRAQAAERALTEDEIALLRACYDERVERYLAAGCGSCLLRNEEAAQALAAILLHDNGVLYAIHAFCIMPNHLHVIVGGFPQSEALGATIQEWKSVSAHRLNHLLGHTGPVWTKDAYTRIIRDEREYHRQLSYVWNNPESADLTEGFHRERFVTWG